MNLPSDRPSPLVLEVLEPGRVVSGVFGGQTYAAKPKTHTQLRRVGHAARDGGPSGGKTRRLRSFVADSSVTLRWNYRRNPRETGLKTRHYRTHFVKGAQSGVPERSA